MTRIEEPPQDGCVLRVDYERFYPFSADWDGMLSFIRILVADGALWFSTDARLLKYEGGRVVKESVLR